MEINNQIKQKLEKLPEEPKKNWFNLRIVSGFIILLMTMAAIGSIINYYQISNAAWAIPKFVPMPTAIDPNFITQVNECFMPTAAVYGYTLRITSGFRSRTDQAALYAQGRTVDGHIVTEATSIKSIHIYGFAVDVVDRWNGYDIDWLKLGKIGSYCNLEQGPDGDLAHFEHRGGFTTADFAAGQRPGPLMLPCSLMDTLAKANKPLTLSNLKACGAPDF